MIMKRYIVDKERKIILKETSRTLYLSISILPAYVKYMLANGYLICRALDSIVDCKKIDNGKKKDFLSYMYNIFEKKFDYSRITELVDIKHLVKSEHTLLKKLPYIIEKIYKETTEEDKKLFRFLVKGVIRGMLYDIKYFPGNEMGFIPSYSDLVNYARLIGGVPALFWYRVYLNYRDDIFTDNVMLAAYRVGTALQMTNILKDIFDDLRNNRCYIPREYLEENNIKYSQLFNPSMIEKILPFIHSLTLSCVEMFDESEMLISSIKPDEFKLKLALIWPVYWALDSLYLVVNSNPLEKRIKIPRKKIYSTIFSAPKIFFSNESFKRGYRFRREILLLSVKSDSVFEV